MTDPQETDSLFALLEGWREPSVREDFTHGVIQAVQSRSTSGDEESKIVHGFFGDPLRQGLAAAACLALVLTVISSTLKVGRRAPSDLVDQALDSDDAVTELNRLIYWEELANNDSLEAMDDVDMAMLLFTTGS